MQVVGCALSPSDWIVTVITDFLGLYTPNFANEQASSHILQPVHRSKYPIIGRLRENPPARKMNISEYLIFMQHY